MDDAELVVEVRNLIHERVFYPERDVPPAELIAELARRHPDVETLHLGAIFHRVVVAMLKAMRRTARMAGQHNPRVRDH